MGASTSLGTRERDFRKVKLDSLRKICDAANKKWNVVTDWLGDNLFYMTVSEATTLKKTDDDYYKLFDKNNMGIEEFEKIVAKVYGCDATYASEFNDRLEAFQGITAKLKDLEGRIWPTPTRAIEAYGGLFPGNIFTDAGGDSREIMQWGKAVLAKHQQWAKAYNAKYFPDGLQPFATFQCTWWAYVRRRELGLPAVKTGDGKETAQHAIDAGIAEKHESPQIGDYVSMYARDAGHVAIVEAVNEDGSIVISECGGGKNYKFNVRLITKKELDKMRSVWTFAG